MAALVHSPPARRSSTRCQSGGPTTPGTNSCTIPLSVTSKTHTTSFPKKHIKSGCALIRVHWFYNYREQIIFLRYALVTNAQFGKATDRFGWCIYNRVSCNWLPISPEALDWQILAQLSLLFVSKSRFTRALNIGNANNVGNWKTSSEQYPGFCLPQPHRAALGVPLHPLKFPDIEIWIFANYLLNSQEVLWLLAS